MNPTRKFYQLLSRSNKPTEEQILQVISTGEDFKNLTNSRAWRKIVAWIETMDKGGSEYLHGEVRNVSALGVLSIFNTFIKFLFVSAEMRAFKKLMTFVDTTIQKGEQENAKLQARKQTKDKE
jgi:hypothetical protein